MSLRSQGFSALACLFATACLATSSDPADWEEVDSAEQTLDKAGFFPGRGYFLNADSVASDCVVPAAYGLKGADGKINTDLTIVPVRAANTGGQEVSFKFSKVESAQELQDELHIGASAAARFLVAGGEAKFDFSESTSIKETSTTLVASLVVRNTSWTVPPGVKLHPDAVALLQANDTKRFRERCGDAFLHSYTTGGEFYAIIQVNTSSKEEAQKIKSSVEGNFLTASGSVEFEKTMQSIVKNSSTSVRSYQLGGSGIEATPCPTVACVADRLSKFTVAVAARPVVFDAEALAYDVLALPTDAVTPLDISTRIDTLKDINVQRNATRDLLGRFLDVQSAPERYALGSPNATLADITGGIATINGNLNGLDGALKDCARDPSLCKLPTPAAVSVKPPPAKPSERGISLLRSYAAPSEFLGGYFKPLGELGGGCKTELPQTAVVADRAALSPFSFIAGFAPSNESGLKTTSLQPVWAPTKYLTAIVGYSNCGFGTWFLQGTPSESARAEAGSFYVVPGLNGKRNTYSLRRFTSLEPSSGPRDLHNRTADLYLVRKAATDISSAVVTSGSDTALKDSASWYLEAP